MNLLCKYATIILFLVGNISFCMAQKVNFSGFTLYQNEDDILVHWNIDSGATCNGIGILRSIEDTLHFIEVGYIPGVCGNSTSSTPYNFSDNNPELNKTNYYKIRMGFSQFSETKSIYLSYIQPNELLLLPNPSHDFCEIKFNNEKHESLSIEITNDNGQQVFFIQDIKQDVYKLNVSFLKSGTYTILLSNNGKKLAQNRLVVTP